MMFSILLFIISVVMSNDCSTCDCHNNTFECVQECCGKDLGTCLDLNFDAGYGDCSTYVEGNGNHSYCCINDHSCDNDKTTGAKVSDVCSECGQCVHDVVIESIVEEKTTQAEQVDGCCGTNFCSMDQFVPESVATCDMCLFDQQCVGFQEAFEKRENTNYATGLVYCCPDAKRCVDRRETEENPHGVGCPSGQETADCGYQNCGGSKANQSGYPFICNECANADWASKWALAMNCDNSSETVTYATNYVWTHVGHGGCSSGNWFKIGSASSVEEAQELMISHAECSQNGSMLFYSPYSYSESWGVRCALLGDHEECTENNSNWQEYVLSYGCNSNDDCSNQFQFCNTDEKEHFEGVCEYCYYPLDIEESDSAADRWRERCEIPDNRLRCSTHEDCFIENCFEESWELSAYCYEEFCYHGFNSGECENQENGFSLGENSWCWDGRNDSHCLVEEISSLQCATVEDCMTEDCYREDWSLSAHCHDGFCYHGYENEICQHQENGYLLGENLWCWDGRSDSHCLVYGEPCPTECVDSWIGDGVCDDPHCTVCKQFSGEYGTFDGGDCECNSCVTDFDMNGGCHHLFDEDVESYIPKGCDHCGNAAMEHCCEVYGQCMDTTTDDFSGGHGGCPSECVNAWVGDGICDDPHCTECHEFINEGTFDGGDCECTSCVQDFANNGGCHYIFDEMMVHSFVPEGCYHCEHPAKEYCCEFEGQCETDENPCPEMCVDYWIGDGVCDESYCNQCANFFTMSTFDGGDCDCESCVQQFDMNGGCHYIFDETVVHNFIPAGCDQCGAFALDHCCQVYGECMSDMSGESEPYYMHVYVNHMYDNPGFYSCDYVPDNDMCLAEGQCVIEELCPEVNGMENHGEKCPSECIDSWIGDGICDDPHCTLCDNFSTAGYFDGGDCDCESCVAQFDMNGGCHYLFEDEVHNYVPQGCYHCEDMAFHHCCEVYGECGDDMSGDFSGDDVGAEEGTIELALEKAFEILEEIVEDEQVTREEVINFLFHANDHLHLGLDESFLETKAHSVFSVLESETDSDDIIGEHDIMELMNDVLTDDTRRYQFVDELLTALRFSDSEIEHIFNVLDRNGSDALSVHDFSHYMMTHFPVTELPEDLDAQVSEFIEEMFGQSSFTVDEVKSLVNAAFDCAHGQLESVLMSLDDSDEFDGDETFNLFIECIQNFTGFIPAIHCDDYTTYDKNCWSFDCDSGDRTPVHDHSCYSMGNVSDCCQYDSNMGGCSLWGLYPCHTSYGSSNDSLSGAGGADSSVGGFSGFNGFSGFDSFSGVHSGDVSIYVRTAPEYDAMSFMVEVFGLTGNQSVVCESQGAECCAGGNRWTVEMHNHSFSGSIMNPMTNNPNLTCTIEGTYVSGYTFFELSGCPMECVESWIGDKICDDPHCNNCENFLVAGIFDGGDCDCDQCVAEFANGGGCDIIHDIDVPSVCSADCDNVVLDFCCHEFGKCGGTMYSGDNTIGMSGEPDNNMSGDEDFMTSCAGCVDEFDLNGGCPFLFHDEVHNYIPPNCYHCGDATNNHCCEMYGICHHEMDDTVVDEEPLFSGVDCSQCYCGEPSECWNYGCCADQSNHTTCPKECTDSWIGDGICDDPYCNECHNFIHEGEFDGGDCDMNYNFSGEAFSGDDDFSGIYSGPMVFNGTYSGTSVQSAQPVMNQIYDIITMISAVFALIAIFLCIHKYCKMPNILKNAYRYFQIIPSEEWESITKETGFNSSYGTNEEVTNANTMTI